MRVYLRLFTRCAQLPGLTPRGYFAPTLHTHAAGRHSLDAMTACSINQSHRDVGGHGSSVVELVHIAGASSGLLPSS